MAFNDLMVTEIFHSLQGETSLSGVRFAFIRLTGCNLRCVYCDSAYSFKNGHRMTIESVLKTIQPYQVEHVLITGGEPLMQRQTPTLLGALKNAGYRVSIETHGEAPIDAVVDDARIVLDIKTPGSKMNRGGFEINLEKLKRTDEIKFVITSNDDYEWARDFVRTRPRYTDEILFSPAVPAAGMPGTFVGMEPRALADAIIRDQLPVRFQFQLHKFLWGMNQKGV